MKQNINEIKRMQQLAGILKENIEDEVDPFSKKYMSTIKNYINTNFQMLSPNDGANIVNVIESDPSLEEYPYRLDKGKMAQVLRPIMMKVGENDGPWDIEAVDNLLNEFEEWLDEVDDKIGRAHV